MLLRDIHFPPVVNAAGGQGFFGEGYPYHRWWKKIGLSFMACGFIAKTTTLEARRGYMDLKDDLTPVEWKPKCIVVKPFKGVVLNAVGLSGPGAKALLEDGRWQYRESNPFFLSFMSVAETVNDRLNELSDFIRLLKPALNDFNSLVGLEINFSCPNAGIDTSSLINETNKAFNEAAKLNIPIQAKFNATMSIRQVCEACNHSACDALTMSNTIPWGKLPDKINWKKLFGSDISPLADLGGGGLSGPPLTPIICDWIKLARLYYQFRKPIWACGGIDSCRAVDQLKKVGASGVQLGTVAMVRPWRMKKIIQYAHDQFPL